MSENKHTPEPWHLCEVENETGRIKHLVPVDSEKLSLLTIVENDQGTFAAIYNDEDARRIVACVNACKGIPTELLERFKTIVGSMDEVSKIEKQRDELLAVLEFMFERISEPPEANCSCHLSPPFAHPKRQQLEQQVTELIAERDAAMKDAERWRTVELLMFLGNVELNQDEDGGYKILLFPAENIVDQGWEGNSPEQVVDAVKCYGQPEKSAKTEVQSIVFFPAGSLGEEIEEEGRPA